LKVFHEAILDQKVSSIHMNWRPPAGGKKETLDKLEKMMF
jgi:hypothetical protein